MSPMLIADPQFLNGITIMKHFIRLSIFLIFSFTGIANAQSSNEARLEIAAELRNSNRIGEAYNIALSLATAGDPEAMAFMTSLANYQNAPLSREEAAGWAQQAADLGHAKSQWDVANYYRFGRYGYPRDLQLALEWARKSATQGHTWAHQTILSIGSRSNLVSQEEMGSSASAIEAVADSGDYHWMNKVGENYQLGMGVPRDFDIAAEWFLRVLEAEGISYTYHYYAMVGLAEIYTETAVSVENIEQALDLFLTASSDQFCAQSTSLGDGQWGCSAVKSMDVAEARLREIKCTAGFDQSVIRNPVELFECDQLAAISHFAQEQRITILVDEIGVLDGSLLIESWSESDWRDGARDRLRVSNPELTWDENLTIWAQPKPALPYTCTMDLSAAQNMQQGDRVEVRATLRNLNGVRPDFDCRL